ncbi:MAG: esterase-like activity of phytase family protein [Saprospiraceae bacterium]|nr:esterase-like activity of phytase family protein [Saprospiraceae bacterium]
MGFTFYGTGTREAESYDGSTSGAAKLVVEFFDPNAPTGDGLAECEDELPEGNREFELSPIGTYNTGIFDESAAEIVAFDTTSGRLFFTNANDNVVTALDISNPSAPTKIADFDMSTYGGGVNSVDASNGVLAIAMEAEEATDPGSIVFLDTDGNLINQVTVGSLPDMVTFNNAGTKVITANEGEPNDNYDVDPEGSVSIIDISNGVENATVTNVTFESFNDKKVSLQNKGVRIFGPNATVAQDLEPEYVAVTDNDSLAYVALQENNAFAVIDLVTDELIDILPLGYKNHNTGQPLLTEFVLNELIDMPELGTPSYGGGQDPVFLGGFSGLYFDANESTDSLYVFYAIPDRGPNDAAVNRNNVTPASPTNLRPFKLPDYQGRIAKFTLDIVRGEASLDDQILLTRADGTTPISGRGNIPGFDETPVVPADVAVVGTGNIFTDDFQDEMVGLGKWTAFSVASDSDWSHDDFQGDFHAEMNGFGADEASEDWLITLIDSDGTTPVYVSFFTAKNFDGGSLEVLSSQNYTGSGDPNLASWADGTSLFTLSSGNFEKTYSGEVEVPADNPFYLAFKYTSTGTGPGDGALWQVDDINVSTTPLESNGDFVDADGNGYTALDFDEFGGDFESVLRDPNGDFWMCDEYRPAIYHFDTAGVLVDRFVPIGTSMLGTTPQPVGTYGTETLPAIYAKRRANRGFEGMALNTDDGYLYAFIQSPIEAPDNSVRNNTDVIRILAVNPADGTPVAEYVYLLESNANRGFDIGRVDKIGDVVYAGNGKFMVLERDSSVPGQDEGKKFIFEVNMTGATNILGTAISLEDGSTGMSLEQMTADEIVAAGVQPVHKTKVLNLPSIGYLPSDKPEGLAILPGGDLAVLNDNDFGLAGAGVSDNSTLGIIQFCDDNGFDASNRSDAIEIQNWPTLGIYNPDAIRSFSVGGRDYVITANEGDSRDYDGYSEEERVADLVLDPTAFPNAAEIQADELLGRLKTTTANGDLDGDGDFDQIYSYGGRSFSIFDKYGNLVYDSGNEFERIIAELDPANFNSTNDENDSGKNRSDDKGPEPEAIEVVVKGDTIYALIGLERQGGIFVYNITDPAHPYYVNYVNNRDFSVEDATTPEVGDLGIEDIVYISADDSPTGSPLVVTANEVSGTVTLFGVEFDKPGFFLRIVHNNDGESKLLPTDVAGMQVGGAAQFKVVADNVRSGQYPNLMLSSGDNFLAGTAFNASLNRAPGLPLYDAVVLDEIGYDAICIGNHDFDFGPDILERMIGDFVKTQPPYLSANLDFSAEPGLQALVDAGRIAKRTVFEKDGEKIGVIGLITDAINTISTPRNVVVDPDIMSVAQQQIDELIAEGVNKIILISHLQSINNEIELVGMLSGVDVVIAGGGDELLTNNPDNAIPGLSVFDEYPIRTLNADGDTAYIVTTPGEYRFVGNLVVEFDEEGGVIAIADESDVILVADGEADLTIQNEVIDSVVAYQAALETNIIAITEVDLDGTRTSIRSVETNQGNLIADAFLWLANKEAANFNLDPSIPIIAVQNGGGIRNNEIIPANSEISELKTFEMLPFDNFVSILNPLTPAQLKSALENAVERHEDGDGAFLQIAGFRIVWDDLDGQPGINRIVSATLDDGTPIVENYEVVDGAPNVYIVTNSFTAGGGDSYDEFAAAGFQNLGTSYQKVLFDFILAEDGVNGVITAADYPEGGEGRIQTRTTAVEELDLDGYQFLVSPNPSSTDFIVRYDLPEVSQVSITLMNAIGQEIRTVTAEQQLAGDYNYTINASDLSAGVYILRVQIDGKSAATRLIKQ